MNIPFFSYPNYAIAKSLIRIEKVLISAKNVSIGCKSGSIDL